MGTSWCNLFIDAFESVDTVSLSGTVGDDFAIFVFLRVAVTITGGSATRRHSVFGDNNTGTIFTTVPGITDLFATTAKINITKTHVGRIDDIGIGTVGNAVGVFIKEGVNLGVNSVLLRTRSTGRTEI